MRAIDLTGLKIGRWTVLERASNSLAGSTQWSCECECGTVAVVNGIVLRDKRSQSCGCLKSEVTSKRSTKHGHANAGKLTPTYHSWVGMTQRCLNPKNEYYADYGGRGVTLCERWKTFALFLEDMGEKPPKTTLDRIDNEKGYEPGNCRWATGKQQGRNKRNNRLITLNGVTRTMIEWSEVLNLPYSLLSYRASKGWLDEDILTTPSQRSRQRKPT